MTALRLRLSGLLATLTLTGLVVGTPLVLLLAGRAFWVRGALPSGWSLAEVWSLVTRPDDGTLLVLLLVGLGWMAWAVLSLLVGVEVAAVARGVRAPHLPGLPQTTARRLVTTAMLLFLAAPQLPTATAVAAPPGPVASTQPAQPEPAREQASAAKATPRPDTIEHVVQRGESLWSIAKRHLGSGSRYTEIVALNHDLLGGRPSFLRPGWVLHLPAPASVAATASTYTVERGDTLSEIAEDLLGDADAYPSIVEASRDIEQPRGRRLIDPDVIDVGWTLNIPSAEPAPAASTDEPAPEAPTRMADEPAAPAAGPSVGEAQPPAVSAPQTPAATPTASPQAPTAPAAPQEASAPASITDAEDLDEAADAPAWQIAGLAGAGVTLAAGLWVALRRRRAAQFRSRRPGRMIAGTPPELAPYEKTIATLGRAAAPTVEFLDSALRRLAHRCADTQSPLPAVRAVELTDSHLLLHLADNNVVPPTPWEASEGGLVWRLAAGTDPDDIGALDSDLPAPYPLLVTCGTADDGGRWLANLEQAGITTITGPADVVADFARYLVAEVAVNTWSRDATVAYSGLGDGVHALNPRRITSHDPADLPATAADLLAATLTALDRNHDASPADPLSDIPTARAHQLGDELWDARLLVCAPADQTGAVAELLGVTATHPNATGTAVLALNTDAVPHAWRLEVDADRRLRAATPLPALAAVGLSAEDAEGCAALLEQAGTDDTEIPDLPGDTTVVDQAGQLHTDLVVPRSSDPTEPCASLLPAPDEEYVAVAATTAEDLAVLAPQIPQRVSAALDTDPGLDDDLRAWNSSDCPLPRLSVLGPITVRVGPTGDRSVSQGRSPQLTDLLVYLATRPNGATTREVAQALATPEPRVRKIITIARAWLGTNPRTGIPHIPDARHTQAAGRRGHPAYEAQDVLVDADLFRRLRVRAQARGAAGIADLEQALTLVRGVPFDELRENGGAWLYEGDRLDHILQAAIADVAHTVATARLHEGNTTAARTAAETALQAVPGDETAQLDLAAVLAAEGDHQAARQHVRTSVCARSDDEDPIPADLTVRSSELIDAHGWLTPKQRPAV